MIDQLDPEFAAAWEEQFGATVDETRILIDFVEDLGIKSGKAVIEAPREAFTNLSIEGRVLREPAASRVVDELTFYPRARWRHKPEGFEDKDRFPWRYRRRLSVLRVLC